ncbi:hypothetical protein [Spirilliplanes yamanashiensis]|uniref:Uncharacterized protein n=1 Tax=Spirilliplanes yamanashiensis TaxID=42233 RepID=A0A8J4DJW3_9ACTN|nr:hypothetical protein [Spirilliplanes yamanashiensis]MDP9817807.1 hypothetical protein [Spirilliplanes yamanashiensis]GIJ04617.1 hypothetical protein Sya03_39690 [Spirilliplanes yamanashiensis]
MPVVLFTGVTTGTVVMQAVEDAAARAQVLRTVAVEALAVAGAGVVAGTAASLVTILPFGYARTGEPWPSVALWPGAAVAAAAVALTLAACLGAARRALAGPAVDAVRA